MKYIKKDISSAEQGIVMHGVNCKGVMGAGVARALRNRYPSIFTNYSKLCKTKGAGNLGTIDVIDIGNLRLVNAFTQINYGRAPLQYVSYEAIKNCLVSLDYLDNTEFGNTIYIPKIGTGLGGGDWNVISKIFSNFEEESEFEFIVCEI